MPWVGDLLREWLGVAEFNLSKVDVSGFLDHVRTQHPDQLAVCQQVLSESAEAGLTKYPQLLLPLYRQWSTSQHYDFGNMSSTEGEHLTEQFRDWVKMHHPDIFQQVTHFDSVHGDEYGDSFYGLLQNLEMYQVIEKPPAAIKRLTWDTASTRDWLAETGIPQGWEAFFKQERVQKQLQVIDEHLALDKKFKCAIFPPLHEVFRVFQLPPAALRVMLIAQDPYHNPHSAEGLCFSVREGNTMNPSLRNVLKAVKAQGFSVKDGVTSLVDWFDQGVFLYNVSLTVLEGRPGQHRRVWTPFSEALMEFIQATCQQPLVWLLWGMDARRMKKYARDTDLVLTCAHPSPLAGNRFLEAQQVEPHFQRCNTFLTQHDLVEIDWSLTG